MWGGYFAKALTAEGVNSGSLGEVSPDEFEPLVRMGPDTGRVYGV